MAVPGSNLLSMALRVIGSQLFEYYPYASRALDNRGIYLSTYNAPLAINGSIQAVPRNIYEHMGLDFQKNYKMFFVSKDVLDIERDVSGDLMIYAGQCYQCLSITDWFAMDGWDAVLCILVPNIPLAIGIIVPNLGNYTTGETLQFTVNFNQIVVPQLSPYIQLAAITGAINGNAVYVSGLGTASLVFQYVVQADDTANGLVVTSPVVGTITDVSGVYQANASFMISGIITTQEGTLIDTESGDYIITENNGTANNLFGISLNASAITTETGDPLTTENGERILT